MNVCAIDVTHHTTHTLTKWMNRYIIFPRY